MADSGDVSYPDTASKVRDHNNRFFPMLCFTVMFCDPNKFFLRSLLLPLQCWPRLFDSDCP